MPEEGREAERLRGELGTACALQTRPLGPQQLSVGPQIKRLLPEGLQV